MTALAVIFARGATIVCLVSLNTRLIADGRYSAAVGVSGLLSACWWINARIANRADGLPPLLAYASARPAAPRAGFGSEGFRAADFTARAHFDAVADHLV